MNKIFDPDHWFWRGFGRLADYFILSMVWLACCIPVITAGTATITLFDTVSRCIRGGEDNMMRRYFSTFKKELLRGILLTLLWAIPGYLLTWGWQVIGFLAVTSAVWSAFRVAYMVTLLLPLAVLCWVVAIEPRFVNRFFQLHRSALTLTVRYLPQTAAMAGILAAALILVGYLPYLILFLPAAAAHLQSIFAEQVFDQYMPGEEKED